jgi:hypothetical protein
MSTVYIQRNLHIVIVPSLPPSLVLHMSSKMLHFVDAPTVVSLTDVGEDH